MNSIGRSLHITGEITSGEDITIDGHVSGWVSVRDATLHVGAEGRVNGDLRAPRIVIDGRVKGGVYATERIEVRSSAVVEGNLSAIRIAMADGAQFNGGIDMAQRTIAAKVAQFKAAR